MFTNLLLMGNAINRINFIIIVVMGELVVNLLMPVATDFYWKF